MIDFSGVFEFYLKWFFMFLLLNLIVRYSVKFITTNLISVLLTLSMINKLPEGETSGKKG